MTLLLLLQLFMSKAVVSKDLVLHIPCLLRIPPKCYKIRVQIAWKKNQQNPPACCEIGSRLLLLLRVARQALVDLMLNWKLHDLFQNKGQIRLLSITNVLCLGNMIMLCVRSCHKMSFGSRYSIKRPSNSLPVEQKRINLSVTSPNASNLPVDSITSVATRIELV